jgi:starch-binding outer membrane protein, SusD/RagB family
MKKKFIFMLIALLAFNIQSCQDFLKEELVSEVAGGYYTSAAGLEDAVDATYFYLKFIYSNERAYTLTAFGTDTYTNGADGNFKGFNYYDNTLNSAQSVLTEMWQFLYRGINQANAVLGRSANGITDMDATRLLTRQAEVRFLRAMYYFTLVRQWQDVHLSLEETIGAQVTANKTPSAQIYAEAIIPDLQFAIDNLPATQSDYGRATKGAAQHLMGLALLTRGWATNNAADFSTAEARFTDVINNAAYGLVSDHASLWNQDNTRNREIIFAVQNATNTILNGGEGTPGEGNRGHLYFLMEYDIRPGMIRDIANGRPFKRFRPTNYLYDLYAAGRDKDNRYDQTYKHVYVSNNGAANAALNWTAANVAAGAKNRDGSPAVVGQRKFTVGDTAIFLPGPGRDAIWTATKKLQTRYAVFTRTPNGAANTGYDERIFAHISKFIDPRRPTIQWMEGSRDWFVYRLADTYLLRAEARFKQGNTTGAAADINVVRTRAAKPGKVADMQITPAQVTLDFILDERAMELDAEQCRWYDLVRTGTLVARVLAHNPQAPGIKSFHVRRPIPQLQIDRTQGGYVQNCGYPGAPACN